MSKTLRDVVVAPVQPEHIVKEAYEAYMEGLKDALENAYKLAELLDFAEAKAKLDFAGETLEKLAGLPLLADEEDEDGEETA